MIDSSDTPLPPDELIDRVVVGFSNDAAEHHRALFLESGRRSFEDFRAALAAVGDSLDNHRRILEFGCGCGRIMRWMAELPSSELVGTDIDVRAVEWASENLPFARFDLNEPMPPTRYADGEFDLVLNHSVFTHLDADYQDSWLGELQRITAPGAVLVISVHGSHAFETSERELPPGARERKEWRAMLERDGILFIAEDAYIGSTFPDFYHTTFHAPWYIFEHWTQWFDLLGYLPRSSLDHQDQVVLRRRDTSESVSTPIKARPLGATGDVVTSNQPPQMSGGGLLADTLPRPPANRSRFGIPGLIARKAIFRAARPVLHTQHRADRELATMIASLRVQIDELRKQRAQHVLRVALDQQSERIGRLEKELENLRRQQP